MTSTIQNAAELLEKATRVVVLTGAGVSTASGIPDFRGPEGLWTKDPRAERDSDFESYVSDPQLRERAWQRLSVRSDSPPQPNDAHRVLVAFEATGKLRGLVTQNTDGLHLAAGSSPELLVEIHGHNRLVRCLACGDLQPTQDVLSRVAAGEGDPRCQQVAENGTCGGVLKTVVVSFGQALDEAELERCGELVAGCDVLVCVGSTLQVWPVAGLVHLALRAGSQLVIVNKGETAFDAQAQVVVRGDIPEVLGAVLGVSGR